MQFSKFGLKESPSRKAADEAKPSAKPVIFAWNPIDKLTFTVEFIVPGKLDEFEALFYWSEKGKVGDNGSELLDHPFLEKTDQLQIAAANLQSLSIAVATKPADKVFCWKLWEPAVSFENRAAWKAEYLAEESRIVNAKEARLRVETAVSKAMLDIKRCAMPWFDMKLAHYRKNKNQKNR